MAVRDLVTGKEQETTIDPGREFEAGNIVWSPDAKSFALTLATNPCTGEYGVSRTVWAESTTILWVGAETLDQKDLIQEDPRLFATVEWNAPNKVVIMDGLVSSVWQLDIESGEITRP